MRACSELQRCLSVSFAQTHALWRTTLLLAVEVLISGLRLVLIGT